MTKTDILKEVNESSFQPNFIATEDINQAVTAIMSGHEDFELQELHETVLDILNKEIMYLSSQNQIHLDFSYACNLQKMIFEAKKTAIQNYLKDETKSEEQKNKIALLPNQHINLGLRQKNVEVGKWTPPAPMLLNDFIQMCFPIQIGFNTIQIDDMVIKKCGTDYYDKGKFLPGINTPIRNMSIQEWYKIFQTIHFFDDLNGRVGGILINIFSFLIHGHFLKYNNL